MIKIHQNWFIINKPCGGYFISAIIAKQCTPTAMKCESLARIVANLVFINNGMISVDIVLFSVEHGEILT